MYKFTQKFWDILNANIDVKIAFGKYKDQCEKLEEIESRYLDEWHILLKKLCRDKENKVLKKQLADIENIHINQKICIDIEKINVINLLLSLGYIDEKLAFEEKHNTFGNNLMQEMTKNIKED